MKIEVVNHDPAWAATFAAERAVLKRMLGPEVAIEHVGSTAVPGMPAKPIVDVAIGTASLPAVEEACDVLRASGRYIYFPFLERWRPERRYLVSLRDPAARARWPDTIDSLAEADELPFSARSCQIHVVERSSQTFRDLVRLREVLVRDAVARREYANVKLALSQREWSSSRDYAAEKDILIARLIGQSR